MPLFKEEEAFLACLHFSAEELLLYPRRRRRRQRPRPRPQNVRANVKVMEFQSLCIFCYIITLYIILIKPLTTKAHDRRASGDCGTSGVLHIWAGRMLISHNFCNFTLTSC